MTTTPVLLDQDARDRIESELDTNLCVEAGAGTGKTTVLVRRVVALLRTGRATVDELAVITFTEKAARELAARIRFELEQAAASAPGPERARLHAALSGLYRARIQTIHAFAGDLLRERPVEARLDPEFEQLDDLGAEIEFDERYLAWLDQLLAKPNPAVERALRRDFEPKQLRQLVEHAHRFREVLPLAPIAYLAPDLGAFRRTVAGWDRELAAHEDACLDPEDGAYAPLVELRGFATEVAQASSDAELERLVLVDAPWPALKGRKANWSPQSACTDVKAVFKAYRAALEDIRAHLRTEAIVDLLPLAAEFAADYAEQRRSAGHADFDDLLIWARDLVRDNAHVRAHFHRRTPRILVDEFQDTDPIQAELLIWLCAPTGSDAGDWREVRPEPGSLFVVGDPKQSIYRFRRADIAVYDEVKNGPLGGVVEQLEQNFRATEDVLNWVNAVFDRVFEAEPGVQAPNTTLHAVPTLIDGARDRPAVVVVHSRGGDDIENAHTEEASLLARTIARAVRIERWPVRRRTPGVDEVRAAQWRDIAVLVPSRVGVEHLEDALEAFGIPYRHEGGRGFFSRQEVRDLVSVLHAIDDPTDAIAIVAALRSLAFGCSDEELLLWQVANQRFDYRHVGEDGPESVRDALLVLRGLASARRGLSLGELVRAVVQMTGIAAAALTLPAGGEQAAANVLKLVDQARAFSAAGGGTLRAFTGWLARMRDREDDEIDAPVAEETDDVVRIMTVHAAKGLEFPIVALGNTEATGLNQIPPVPDVPAHRLNVQIGPQDRAFVTPGWWDVREEEKHALRAERARLLYVACTRARDHIVVPVLSVPDKAKGFAELLMEDLPQPGEEDVYDVDLLDEVEAVEASAVVVPAAQAVGAAAALHLTWVADRADVIARASRGVEVVRASSLESEFRPLASSEDGESGEAVIDAADTPPLTLGDAFHRVMQLVDLRDGHDLDHLAVAVCEEHGIPKATEAVVEMCRRCLASDAVRRAVEAGARYWREVPFVDQVDESKVIVGRIDLLEAVPELVVVDYKTDVVADVPRHREQLAAYVAAVERAAGSEATGTEVIYARRT